MATKLYNAYVSTVIKMAQIAQSPVIIEDALGSGRWMVVLFNNDVNTFDQVIEILMRATGCGTQEAFVEAWEAHHFGKTPVHFAELSECEIVAHMISSIGLKTEVRREWAEEPVH